MAARTLFLFLAVLFLPPLSARAQTLHLKNGDTLNGRIIEQREDYIKFEHADLGELKIKKDSLKEAAGIESGAEKKIDLPEENMAVWSGELAAGYGASSGNTRNSRLWSRYKLNRKTQGDEFTAKADAYYSSSDRSMDAQKWSLMLRYAFSITRKWYNFYKIESDHDRFADIDYRIVPAAGIGYWFFGLKEFKLLAEGALGFSHTHTRQAADNTNEGVLIGRLFCSREFSSGSKISQDTYLYPSLADRGEFRLRCETSLESPLAEKVSLRFSFVDDYNSDPGGNAKENDLRFLSSLVYSF